MFGLGLKQYTKAAAGRVAGLCFPHLVDEVRRGSVAGDRRRLKGLIARSEVHRLHRIGDEAAVQKALTQRWTSENMPSSWYDSFSERGWAWFSGPHAQALAWLKDYADEHEVTQVIEIGCGNGRVLSALSEAVPTVPRWIGVDINAEIIARCQSDYRDRETLDFVRSDAADWLRENTRPGTLLITNGGVMEYFAPGTLSDWFRLLKVNKGRGVLLIEPVDPSHNLDRKTASYVWGSEQSYSHNHRHLLETAGFQVIHAEEARTDEVRWMLMLADAAVDRHDKT